MTKDWITRFAPTPNWYMHLGHVLSAYFVWGIAYKLGAKIILRIENHDTSRAKPEYTDAILSDLEWLGLHPHVVAKQSDHFDRFEIVLKQLVERNLVYACACSRADVQARNSSSSYDNHCRNKNLDFAGKGLRLRMDDGSDELIRDRNGNFTYMFANVVDDVNDDVNLIIRGRDLLSSVERQLKIRELLTHSDPPTYFHHPLIMSDDNSGQKLSKSNFDHPIRYFREQGHKPQSLLGLAAFKVGLVDQPTPLEFKDWASLIGLPTALITYK